MLHIYTHTIIYRYTNIYSSYVQLYRYTITYIELYIYTVVCLNIFTEFQPITISYSREKLVYMWPLGPLPVG